MVLGTNLIALPPTRPRSQDAPASRNCCATAVEPAANAACKAVWHNSPTSDSKYSSASIPRKKLSVSPPPHKRKEFRTLTSAPALSSSATAPPHPLAAASCSGVPYSHPRPSAPVLISRSIASSLPLTQAACKAVLQYTYKILVTYCLYMSHNLLFPAFSPSQI